MTDDQVEQFFAILRAANPHPLTELEYSSVFELLAAVLLSAQATDASVNKATRRLFAVAGTPARMLALGVEGLEPYIRTIGLYRTKARNLIATCAILVEQHRGEVPRTLEALQALPGVGRKTANVVLNVAFGEATIAVDTHVFRVANRTGLAHRTHADGGRGRAAAPCAAGLPRRRTSLADPARPLRLPGTATAVHTLQRRALLRSRTRARRAELTASRAAAAAAPRNLRPTMRPLQPSARHAQARRPCRTRRTPRAAARRAQAHQRAARTAARRRWSPSATACARG